MNKQMGDWIVDGWMCRWEGDWKEEWIDRWKEGRMDYWKSRKMDRCVEE